MHGPNLGSKLVFYFHINLNLALRPVEAEVYFVTGGERGGGGGGKSFSSSKGAFHVHTTPWIC